MAEGGGEEQSAGSAPESRSTRQSDVGTQNVFISYASADKATADSVCAALEHAKIPCWIAPRDVKPGARYADAIVRAINEASALVLVLSAGAMGSDHVAREVERAASKRKQIIAFRIDATVLSPELEYFLSNSQWIDVPALGMPAALAKLAEAVGSRSATSASENPVTLRRGGTPRRIAIITAIMVCVGATVALGVHFWSLNHRAPQQVPVITDKSIAVLPFADMSERKDQQYFSDGLSEDLITALSQLPGLKVIGRTSSFRFRDSKDDSRTIGATLGVAHLLEGSVRHSDDMVRVVAELIDTSDGSTLWSERYDRPFKDLFRLQDDLTRAVAGALRARLIPSETASLQQTDRPPSGNLEAYNAVLEGKYYLARETDDGTRKAIERFTRATQLDPRYAFAWSLLSRAWTDIGAYHVDLALAPDAYSKARAAVNTAISLAPDATSTHIARGWLLDVADLDWRSAETEYRRALELAPGNGDAAAGLARQLANFAQLDRAIELTRQALATDPLHSRWYGWLATYLSALNRLDEAEEAIRRAIELQPGGVRLHLVQTDIEIHRGNAQSALAAAQQEPPGQFRDAALAKALQIGTDRNAADAALKNLLEKDASWDPYDVAQIYAVRNEADKTFEWLDRAWSYRDPAIHYISYDPIFGRYKNDPRFAAFCRKLGLPVPGEVEVPK